MASEKTTGAKYKLTGIQLDQARTDLLTLQQLRMRERIDYEIEAQDGIATGDYHITLVVERQWKKRRG